MSTFGGRVPELENISIDRFDRDNLKSSCFFLSHCHTDHMNGLDDYAFIQLLKKNENFKIYCTPISKLIITNMGLDIAESQIVGVSSKERTIIHVPETDLIPVDYKVTVTFLSAGHCPGSVMFLFETLSNRILYTGDFRYAKGDSEKIKQIHDYLWLKTFDKVYFDATFLNENYWEFPSRVESTQEILHLIEEWLARDSENVVHLETSAKYGYEYVFQKIFQKFGYKVHVEESIYNLYWNVPDIGYILTKDLKNAKIISHAKNSNLSCESKNVLHIKLSAQFYRWKKGQSKPALCHKFVKGNRICAQVCFSTHSSCSELVDFLCYLKPKNVYACTSAVGITEDEKQNYLFKLAQSWLKDKNEDNKSDRKLSLTNFESVTLSNTPVKIKIRDEETETHNTLLDSPPIRRTRLSFNSSIL